MSWSLIRNNLLSSALKVSGGGGGVGGGGEVPEEIGAVWVVGIAG